MDLPRGFLPFDPDGPDDVEEVFKRLHPDAKARGMFFSDTQKLIRDAGGTPPDGRYVPFLEYPIRPLLEMLVDGCTTCFPGVSRAEALRRFGTRAFPMFRATTLGKVLWPALGDDPHRVFAVAGKAYKQLASHSNIEILDKGDSEVHVSVELQGFIYTYNVGVWQGALEALGRTCEIFVRRQALFRGEFILRWH